MNRPCERPIFIALNTSKAASHLSKPLRMLRSRPVFPHTLAKKANDACELRNKIIRTESLRIRTEISKTNRIE